MSVVAELLAHGHTVLGLARSDASATALTTAGAEPLRGSLTDLDVLRDGATRADGVISLAFSRDYGSAEALEQGMAEERDAMAALGATLIGTDKPLVTVSGTPWVTGRPSTEADPLPTTVVPTVYSQSTPPTSPRTGDLWFDLDDDGRMRRWDGGTWQNVAGTPVLGGSIRTGSGAVLDADGLRRDAP